ncbi:MAG: glutathione S-transferase family protein [Sphingomonadaceae bacterium]|nr:glutathione S-transferase family protein [Sphingomonadaceae bacterium]
MTEHLILHEYAQSGNCYKIRLTAAHVGTALERREYDIMKGETRTPEFLANVNANGRIPVLQIGDRFLPESNAACFWLATYTPLIPDDRFDTADMLRWMNWEQYNHEPNVATMRFLRAFVGDARLTDEQRTSIPVKVRNGEAALALMDAHLEHRDFFVGDSPTLADICLYAYTHTAEEGGFNLARYPAVSRWLARVASFPGHVTIDA